MQRLKSAHNEFVWFVRDMKTKFQDFSRIIPGLFSVFKDSISLTFSQFLLFLPETAIRKQVAHHFYHRNIFIMVLINTGTTGKLNQSTVPPRSSTNPAIFTQFSFAHCIDPKEWKSGFLYAFRWIIEISQ